MVLDGGGDDVTGLLPLQGHELHRALQGPVVRLGAAGGEVDLLRPGVEAGGQIGPGLLQVGLGLLAEAVKAGGVAVFLGKVWLHGPQGGMAQRGGGRMVGVDPVCHGSCSFPKSHYSYQSDMIIGYLFRLVKPVFPTF